jgi:NADH-ubiquinone oxidoreductase chain 4
MFNRIAFAGSTSKRFWSQYIPDLNKREFFMLTVLVWFTVLLGIYTSHLLYNIDLN